MLLGLLAIGAGIVASASRRGRRVSPFLREDSQGIGAPEAEFDAAPLVVILCAFGAVKVAAGDGPRVVVRTADQAPLGDAVHDRLAGDGSLHLDVFPRRNIHVTVPRGTAVRVQSAKAQVTVTGVDDVEVRSAKGSINLRDVGGAVRVRSASDMIDVRLSRERETRSVDVGIAKAMFSLSILASRGGSYRIESAKSLVSAPPSVDGGIPVRIRAARAQIAIRAA